MAEIITTPMRKAIKKMAEISQISRVLCLMPTPEDFAMRIIGDLKGIMNMMNRISTRINDILDRYSNIPSEFLLKGFDEVLDKLNDINDYAKFAIKETSDVMSGVVDSAKSAADAIGSAVSTTTSAVLQVGGGLSYGTVAMGANIKLAMTGNGRREMTNDVVQDIIEDVVDGNVSISEMDEEFESRVDSKINDKVGDVDNLANTIKDWTETATKKSTESIDSFFEGAGNGIDKALSWIDDTKNNADELVDNSVGVLIETVEKAKREVEEKIEIVRSVFEKLTKSFDEAFGFVNGKNFAEDTFRNISNTAEQMDSQVFDAIGDISGDVADFIKNFNIGKVVTAFGGLVVGAGAATLAMDLLPKIDIDKMLKDIIGKIDPYRIKKLEELYYNKFFENEPDLLDIPDVPWALSKDDLEKYSAESYEKYIEDFSEENDNKRSEILEKMQKVRNIKELSLISKENKEKIKENKSALKAMRKVRRNAIKAKQIEKYKDFLKTELEYLKKECLSIKRNIKTEWDSMMGQYKYAVSEIVKFFSVEGCGGSESVDRCCDRINDDATQIVELCQSLPVILTSMVSMVPTPYAIGTCVDMPVHKLLSFLKDIKIVITYLKNLIRLGIDIISQLTILVKIICSGLQNMKEIMNTLKELIGIDKIINMINFLIELFRPKMADAKLLLENSISPVYYNETDEYEEMMSTLEEIMNNCEDDSGKITLGDFYSRTDELSKDYVKISGANLSNDGIVEYMDALEEKGNNDIVAYRSPILNAEGDDFAGWIFYHATTYDNINKNWAPWRQRLKNKLINRASRKNKMIAGRLSGGVSSLKKNQGFGYYNDDGTYIGFSVTGYDAYYWYTKWTNEPTDCVPDMKNEGRDVVVPIQTTSNGSLVELSDGRRVFVEGKTVKSGDFVNVNGVKYKVK